MRYKVFRLDRDPIKPFRMYTGERKALRKNIERDMPVMLPALVYGILFVVLYVMTLTNEAAHFPLWMHIVFWLHWYMNDTNSLIPSPQKASQLWFLFIHLGMAQIYNLKKLELFDGESDCKNIQDITPTTINEMFTNYRLVSL